MVKSLTRTLCLIALLFIGQSFAQNFRTAQEIANNMTIGWNIGNTMEALYINNGQIVAEETAWGNAKITQRLIDSVKAVGFNTVRIPIAWDVHVSNGIIDAAWIARVKEVIDYCYKQDMYVMINIHWDNGWLEENCTPEKKDENNLKQANYWTQIATYFKAYDDHLLFASANEPHVADATQMAVLLSYHQTFVNTVRGTGGNNAKRILIVQGPATDIEKTNNLMNTLPSDLEAGRMMVEVHFYPYQFSLMNADADWGKQFYYWGACNHSTSDAAHNPTWGEEVFVDESFQLMKTKFVDRGYPVVLGEFGAKLRTNLNGANFDLHKQSREYFLKYTVNSALKHGIIPVYWCAGLGELFDRNTGATLESGTVHALMEGAYTSSASVNCGNNDCKGVKKGHAYLNECNVCVLGFEACIDEVTDCNGDIGGTAILDDCGVCVSGNSSNLPCVGSIEAEEFCVLDGTVDSNHGGWSGSGFINSTNAVGANARWTFNSNQIQMATIGFRYANGSPVARNGKLSINEVYASDVILAPTGAWTTWETSAVTIQLKEGTNEIEISADSENGLANIDYISFSEGVSDASCLITGITLDKNMTTIVHPNPTYNTVSWELPQPWQLKSTLGNVLGTGNGTSIDLSAYAAGIYFIDFVQESTVKVVKQ